MGCLPIISIFSVPSLPLSTFSSPQLNRTPSHLLDGMLPNSESVNKAKQISCPTQSQAPSRPVWILPPGIRSCRLKQESNKPQNFYSAHTLCKALSASVPMTLLSPSGSPLAPPTSAYTVSLAMHQPLPCVPACGSRRISLEKT